MKKIFVTSILSACMLFSSLAVSAAENDIKNYEEFVIQENPNSNEYQDNVMASDVKKGTIVTKQDIDAEFDRIAKMFNNNKANFTAEKRKKALKYVDELEKKNIIRTIGENTLIKNDSLNVIVSSDSDYDQNKAKLREANFIEGILDLDEGMSSSEIYKVGITHANRARDEALIEFPNTDYTSVMLRDAFRHFTWNFLSTKDVGNYKTRTATINHEWGIRLLQPMLNYFDSQYSYYVSRGYSNSGTLALADTVSYIPVAKYYAVSACEGSFNYFKSFFDNANIMDLHNNCWGRAYAGNYLTLTFREAFYTARANNELILSENAVTNANYDYVWRSNWYTY